MKRLALFCFFATCSAQIVLADSDTIPAAKPAIPTAPEWLTSCVLRCLQNFDGENFRLAQYYCLEAYDEQKCEEALGNFDPTHVNRCTNGCLLFPPGSLRLPPGVEFDFWKYFNIY